MNRPNPLRRILRGLLPWLFSLALLGYVLLTQDLKQVGQALAEANIMYFVFWVVLFQVFWLFLNSLFFYLCLRWYVDAPSPDPEYKLPPSFSYYSMVKASAASYLLYMINFVLGYGGLAVYFHRRFGVTYKRATAVMLSSLLHSFAALGLLAFVASRMIPREMIPDSAVYQIELAGLVGTTGLGFYLLCFCVARLWIYLPERLRGYESIFTPFVRAPIYSYGVLLLIQVVMAGSAGLLVMLTMPAFNIDPPAAASLGLSQVVWLARGLPISALGIGLDQLTFPYLFKGWAAKEALVAFSIAFTFSLVALKFVIGLPFFTRAAREMFEEKVETGGLPTEQ